MDYSNFTNMSRSLPHKLSVWDFDIFVRTENICTKE